MSSYPDQYYICATPKGQEKIFVVADSRMSADSFYHLKKYHCVRLGIDALR